MNLYQSSLLVYVTASVWTARRLDKGATKKLTDDANAVESAARVNKHLLADADAMLKRITATAQAARRLVDERTLPWDDSGMRITSNAGALKLVAEFEGVRSEFYNHVDEFIKHYPELRERALVSLGALADPEEYPEPEALRDRFRLRLALTPVAETFVTATREGITREQTDLLERHYQQRVREQQETALAAAWERLRSDAQRLADRLEPGADGKRQVLRDAVVTNLRETAETLSTLNVFQSTELDNVCQEVQSLLRGIDAADLRDDSGLAKRVQEEANAIVSKLAGLI